MWLDNYMNDITSFHFGQRVTVNGIAGMVTASNLVHGTVTVRTFDGVLVVSPNDIKA